MGRRRIHSLSTDGTGPSWLLRLRDAVFAHLPAKEEAFVVEDVTYLCRREIDSIGEHLLFRESWLNPFTLDVVHSWHLEIQAGAFAGYIPDKVFEQQLEVLVRGINAQRPRKTPAPRETAFLPHRFAHRPANGRVR